MYLIASTLFATGALILARPSTVAGFKMPCASDAALTVEMPTVTPAGRSLLQIVWDELEVAQGDEKHLAVSAEKAIVGGVDYDTKYNVLVRSGDQLGEHTFGLLLDKDMQPIIRDGEPFVSYGNDFSSLVPKGDKVYMITHHESPDPGATYLTRMTQDVETGALTVDSFEPIDWSEYGGVWVPCAGSVTPWQTHFGSEEYEPDARALHAAARDNPDGLDWKEQRISTWVTDYFKMSENSTNAEVVEVVFPYMYGYPWEVKVSDDGEIESRVKHMAMGRLAIELPYMMPDQQTVYITDDGTNVMLGVYKMSTAGDLSCGTLHAAKMTQTSDEGGGAFDVEWIQVGGEMCTDEVLAVAKTTTFFDLFDVAEPNMDTGSCPKGYTSINAQAGLECLSIKEGMHDLAARFEFRRVSAVMGATVEFSKWEGITFDTKRRRIYTAMSEIREGMEDFADKGEPSNEFDLGDTNDVRLAHNPCGCVYVMDVDADYMAVNMYELICGTTETGTDEFNECNIDGIAGPDNVAYVSGHDGLIIGEDTDEHQNDVLWWYKFEDGSITRFLSTPYGSETTSPYWYPNINGWSYIMAVVQHPYGESDEDKLDEPEATGDDSWCGYIGPFKAHPNSVDMAAPVSGPRLWNDFPNLADTMFGEMGGYGNA